MPVRGLTVDRDHRRVAVDARRGGDLRGGQVVRADNAHGAHGQGRTEPEPNQERRLQAGDKDREGSPSPCHVRLSESLFRTRPELAAEWLRALDALRPGCPRQKGTPPAELHCAVGPTWWLD